MTSLSIGTAMQNQGNPFAQSVAFDFSDDVANAGPGARVVAYAVALSGFTLCYQTNSDWWAEDAGLAAVTLVPNLVGNVLHVDGNVVLTDFDGDSARAPASQGEPASGAWITALALIDTSPPDSVFLGNAYGQASGAPGGSLYVEDNDYNLAFLAGFSVQATNGRSPISQLSLGTSMGGPANGQVTLTGYASMTGTATTGTYDVGFLSVPGGRWNFDVKSVYVSWAEPDGTNGITGTFHAPFTVPPGQEIISAALLLQSVDIQFDGGNSSFTLIQAVQTNLWYGGGVVSGYIVLNIYDHDVGSHEYISSGSSANVYVIAQFGFPPDPGGDRRTAE